MDAETKKYIDAIAPGNRALFDRVHELILGSHNDIDVTFAYKMPTYNLGSRRIHLASWKHGVSLYGTLGRDGGFIDRHPEFKSGKATVRMTNAQARDIGDQELTDLFRSVLVS
jgi:hypothetical protein